MARRRRPDAQGLLSHAPSSTLRAAAFVLGLASAASTACVADWSLDGVAEVALAADSSALASAVIVPLPDPGERPAFERPEHVRGLYLTAWSAGSSRRLEQLIALARRTEINAFVIDIKDASGFVSHTSGVPLAQEIGANGEPRIRDLPGLLARLQAEGIWPIARIVIVQDPLLAAARPALSVQDSLGRPWVDRHGIVWLNPTQPGVWEYHLDLAEEVVRLGFPEIQWDYVRFPDAPRSELAHARFPGLDRPKEDVIRSFLSYARARLNALDHDVQMTADVFGVTTSAKDVGIGQVWERFIDRVDVALPMVYPSHYYRGSFGYQRPNFYPYEVVRAAMESALKKSASVEGAGRIRPYLQDFDLGQPAYDAPEVRAQIQAAADAGVEEWVLWNPGSRYTEDALAPADGWNGKEPWIRVAGQVVPMSKRFEVLAAGEKAPLVEPAAPPVRRRAPEPAPPETPLRPRRREPAPVSERAPAPDTTRPRVLNRDSLRAWADSVQR